MNAQKADLNDIHLTRNPGDDPGAVRAENFVIESHY